MRRLLLRTARVDLRGLAALGRLLCRLALLWRVLLGLTPLLGLLRAAPFGLGRLCSGGLLGLSGRRGPDGCRCGRCHRRHRRCRTTRGRRGRTGDVHASLEPVESGTVTVFTGGPRQQHPRTHELELQPRAGGPGHLGEPGVDDVGRVRQSARSEGSGLAAHPFDLVAGQAAQHGVGAVGHGCDDDEVAQAFEQVFDEPARVVPRLDHVVDLGEHPRPVVGGERIDGGVEQGPVGEAEQRRGAGVGEALVGRAGDQLVEHRERVTHRSPTRAGDEREHPGLHGDTLGVAQPLHVFGQPGRRHQPERVVVGAGADRADDLLGFGRCEDELHVLRRFLDDLQQRVEALRRHHVRLVDDVDLEPALGRAVGRPLAQVTGVVDTAVAGGVDLDDVDRAGSLAGQRNTRIAGAARRRGGPLLAVETARQDAGAGRLAAAARATEQVGVVDASGAQRLHQRLGDVFLADDIGERLRAVATVEGCAHPTTLLRGTDIHDGEAFHAGGGSHRTTARGSRRRDGSSCERRRSRRTNAEGASRKHRDPPCTWKSSPALAAFLPWGSSVRYHHTRGLPTA